MKHPKKVTLLKGGPGSERDVSLRSGAAVAEALKQAGYEVEELDVHRIDFVPPPGMEFVFNVIHGTMGEDGVLQEILDAHGIPYTGEGVDGSRLAFDKTLTKARFTETGVPSPGFEVLCYGQKPTIPLPLVVKAPCQGSSVGTYIVKTEEELQPALDAVNEYADVFLVEEFVQGRELTVGILGDLALPVIEICPKEGFYDFKNKYPWLSPGGAADHYCPAPLSEEETQLVQQIALQAHRALNLQTYSRVDLLLPESGRPTVLEVNTIPGMTESSLLPEAAAAIGISFPDLCRRMIELSLQKTL